MPQGVCEGTMRLHVLLLPRLERCLPVAVEPPWFRARVAQPAQERAPVVVCVHSELHDDRLRVVARDLHEVLRAAVPVQQRAPSLRCAAVSSTLCVSVYMDVAML